MAKKNFTDTQKYMLRFKTKRDYRLGDAPRMEIAIGRKDFVKRLGEINANDYLTFIDAYELTFMKPNTHHTG